MRKADVISHFGTQQKVADVLTAAGFPISQRAVSGWPDPIPLDRAVQVQEVARTRKLRVDLSVYRRKAPRRGNVRAGVT